MEDPEPRRKRCAGDVLKWKLHAPKVEATTAKFPPIVDRWLKVNTFMIELANCINSENPIAKQLKRATCDLPDVFLQELLDKEIVCEWGQVDEPPAGTLFIGNVFLHPEDEKERWRLIFHPQLFNELVRLKQLQGVNLPRMRGLIKQITEYLCTVKIDLKCAFFQVPIERGIFVFKKKNKLYTLRRLPMGASISVLVAQTLSLMVAEEFISHLKGAFHGYKTNAFVDDIFCSFNPSSVTALTVSTIVEAMEKTTKSLNVTLKIFQLCDNTVSFVRNLLSSRKGVESPTVGILSAQLKGGIAEGGVFDTDDRVAKLEIIESIEVLGVVFDPTNLKIMMKDSFIIRAKNVIESPTLPSTPRALWELTGSCFYVIYALGICPARFYGVFKLLGRVASWMCGADRKDPKWSSELLLSTEEMRSLQIMKDFVSTYPVATFEKNEEPARYIFTDASNLALGVVCITADRIATMSRRWRDDELVLSINSKEVIAAHAGVTKTAPRNSPTISLLGVDNTVAFFDYVNGASRCPKANQCVYEIRTGYSLGLMWIPTELMPADGPSRLVHDLEIPEKIRIILRITRGYAYLPKLL